MSKIKEALLREQDNLMEYYIGFYEWLDKYQPQGLSEKEINNMEEELANPSTSSNVIVSNCTSNKVINNTNYNPKQGA